MKNNKKFFQFNKYRILVTIFLFLFVSLIFELNPTWLTTATTETKINESYSNSTNNLNNSAEWSLPEWPKPGGCFTTHEFGFPFPAFIQGTCLDSPINLIGLMLDLIFYFILTSFLFYLYNHFIKKTQ